MPIAYGQDVTIACRLHVACAVTVHPAPVTMKTGLAINTELRALGADSSPAKTFAASPSAPPARATTRKLTSYGSLPVVAWLDGTVIKYYAQGYTDSNVKIPLNANSSKMFEGCNSLTSIDLSGFDTSNVTNMSEMFEECSSLTGVDLSGWNTSNVTNMYGMFWNCSSLTTIYASSSFVTGGATGSSMFWECTSLVGGAGTAYSSSNTDKTYARIDGGPSSSTPGYFSTR